MTRIAIDSATALGLLRGEVALSADDQLVAPSTLRSQVLAQVYAEWRGGVLDEPAARRLLDGLSSLRIRLLGDRVSRAVAWQIAAQRDLDDIAVAEYLAVAKLQADVLITDDERLRRLAEGIVPVERFAERFPPNAWP